MINKFQRKILYSIRQSSNQYVYFESINKDSIDKQLQNNFYQIYSTNIPITYYTYQKEEFYKNKHQITNISNDFALKSDIDSLGFVTIEDLNLSGLIYDLNIRFYRKVMDTYHISKEDKKFLESLIITEQKPLVLKGTDYPYWFKINEILIPSETSSWFKYLYTKHKIIRPEMLENYNGPDKYVERTLMY